MLFASSRPSGEFVCRLEHDEDNLSRGKIKSRIESLSDLVFGLAPSIGSIGLIQHIPQASVDLNNVITQFGFSFLIIIVISLQYTRIVSGLDVETPLTLYLNLALLFCVVLEPFLFYVLETTTAGLLEYSTSVFGLDIGMMQALLAGMTYLVIRQEKRSKAGSHGQTI